MDANYKARTTTVGRAKGVILCLAGLSLSCVVFLYVSSGMNKWKLWSKGREMENVNGCDEIVNSGDGKLTKDFEPVLYTFDSEEREPVWKRINQLTVKDQELFCLRYLANYKNPCWYELIDDTAIDSFLSVWSHFKGKSMNNSFSTDLLEDYKSRLKWDKVPVRLRCLPYFMVIGQPKCGTTDLYFRIGQHPQVATAITKGPHWWTRKRYGSGAISPATFSSYVDVFAFAAEVIQRNGITDSKNNLHYDMVTGEASPSTLWDTSGPFSVHQDRKDTLKRCGKAAAVKNQLFLSVDKLGDDIWRQWIPKQIKTLLPKVKLIVILRNPTDRLYSDFLYFDKSYNKSRETFHLQVQHSLDIFQSCRALASDSACAYSEKIRNKTKVRLHIGLYAIYLRDWLTDFPRDQIFVVRTEDYSEKSLSVMKKVFDFLQLRELKEKEEVLIRSSPPMNHNRNISKYGAMLTKTRLLLDNFYFPFNRDLSDLLRDVRFMWRNQKDN